MGGFLRAGGRQKGDTEKQRQKKVDSVGSWQGNGLFHHFACTP